MDSRRRRTSALIFTPADLGYVSVALRLAKRFVGSYLESRRAAAQPSLPLTDAALQFQPLPQEGILCTGWCDSSPFFCLLDDDAPPTNQSHRTLLQRRRIIVGFVSHNSPSVILAIVFLCRRRRRGMEGASGGEAEKEKREGVDVESQLRSRDCYSEEKKIVGNQIMHSCSGAEKPQMAPY